MNVKILVATEEEDELSLAKARALLATAGHSVHLSQDATWSGDVAETELAADLVILDVGRDERARLPIARKLHHARHPYVVMSRELPRPTLTEWLAHAPCGFILKPFNDHQFAVTIEVALNVAARLGHSRSVLGRIATILDEVSQRASVPQAPDLASLSPRERVIVDRLLAHARVPRIASELGISSFTVRNHLKSIFRKVGVTSQQELLDRLHGMTQLP